MREPKKVPSAAMVRARNLNLKKARKVNAEKKRQRELVQMDKDLDDLKDKVDTKVDAQVKELLKKVDRKTLKDNILKVFYDMGGPRKMKQWAKENPGKYYTLMAGILKAEADKEASTGGGVTVNIFGRDDNTIDITPGEST
ncbi:hypothetical protein KAR91_56685 [Candidatus Pacearchaeota archaeon]|nr:hypothetical protein [Candidatus Pacearchaeota archaeon]